MPPMYELLPLVDSPERAHILEELTRKTCGFDTAFSDFQATCEEKCFETKPIQEMCFRCSFRFGIVASSLMTGLNWEVWKTGEGEPSLVGVIRLSHIRPGIDALGHYVFFDHDLRGKTGVLKDFIEWCFSEHENWAPLRRLSIEIPDFAFSLIRHSARKLGFGGDFDYEAKGIKIKVEGVRRKSIMWKGQARDIISMGLLNPHLDA